MKLIDKLILGTMVGLLPLGLLVAYFYSDSQKTEEVPETNIDVSGLQQLIATTIAQNQPKTTEPTPFNISTISYASESGILRISGKAPAQSPSVLISVIPLKNNSQSGLYPGADPNLPTSESQKVEVFSIIPDSKGVFNYEYEVPKNNNSKIIELRFDQNMSTKTIRFDLDQKKQVG